MPFESSPRCPPEHVLRLARGHQKDLKRCCHELRLPDRERLYVDIDSAPLPQVGDQDLLDRERNGEEVKTLTPQGPGLHLEAGDTPFALV